jgi:hypothetical protein
MKMWKREGEENDWKKEKKGKGTIKKIRTQK